MFRFSWTASDFNRRQVRERGEDLRQLLGSDAPWTVLGPRQHRRLVFILHMSYYEDKNSGRDNTIPI